MSKIGIDLGTTNSLVACWHDGCAHIIPNAFGDALTPSVVGIDDDGSVIVGRAAWQRLRTHPERTAAAFKRYMGTTRKTKLGKHRFAPEELSALVLKSLKADAEAFLGEPVTEAVISVPAYFSDAQRKATQAAGTLAGLAVPRLINEPTAAAIAHGLHDAEGESTFLVFDLGGGTFDTSVLELFDGVMQVHASAGDNYLGGEDFDQVVAKLLARQIGVDPETLSREGKAGLRIAAERVKTALSQHPEVTTKFVLNGDEHTMQLTRTQFESATQELLERLKAPVRRALRDASLTPDDIDAIVLVGGSTRMPAVRSLCAKMMGRMPHANIDPDQVVALGAATLSALLQRDEALREVVLTDVAPYSMGINVYNTADDGSSDVGDLYQPIIERNSPIPISRIDTFTTVRDFQTEIVIGVYQGESRLVRDNIKLGELTVKVQRGRVGEQCVKVRFTYDVSGLLEVETEVLETGARRRLLIDGTQGALSPKEIEKRIAQLEHLKVHPRDKQEVRELIARAERLYEESLGELRGHIRDQLTTFDQILARQIDAETRQACTDFGRWLDQMDDRLVF